MLNMMTSLSGILAAGAVVIVGAGSSLAATIGPIETTTPINNVKTSFSSGLTFKQFNNTIGLGTLTSVTLNFSCDESSTFKLSNDGTAPFVNIMGEAETTFSVQDAERALM